MISSAPAYRRCPDCDDLLFGSETCPCVRERGREALARLPPLPWARVGDPLWIERVKDRRLRALAEVWKPEDGNVVLLGPSGVGKTGALVALARRLAEQARWCSGLEIARSIRETRLGSQNDELEAASSAGILVLDEIGQELADPRWLLELMDARYPARRTIASSGLTREALIQRYGSGATRRLIEPTGAFLDLFQGGGGGR